MPNKHDDFINRWNGNGTYEDGQRLRVAYDESITRRPGYHEHSARGIEGAGFKTKERKKRLRRRKATRAVGIVTALIIFFTSMYCFLIYSSIPFIEKWRTIYIETAMGTMTHHWMAEAFIPQNVIDSVMNARENVIKTQSGLNSTWVDDTPEEEKIDYALAKRPWKELEPEFSTYYSEIEETTLKEYLANHSDAVNEEGYLFIDEADYGDEDTGIRTVNGDEVCALDTKNGVVIITLRGDTYYGKLAIVKDAAQVGVAAVDLENNYSGDYVANIVENNDAVLGINASGFYDPDGTGDGGQPYGMIFSNGKKIVGRSGCSMKVISIDKDNRLNVSDTKPKGVREAMQFDPAMILNGDLLISGSSGWGLQPRSVIGQTKDGQMMLSVVDGRQAGYSIGITLGDLSDIFYKYGAYQASNLDGGSSSLMYYDGRPITRSSAADSEHGRHVPDAWVVYRP